MDQVSPLLDSPAVVAYLERVGAELRSLFTAYIIRRVNNYESRAGYVRFNREGYVSSSEGIAPPTEPEREAIAREVSQLEFPRQEFLSSLPSANLPDLINYAKERDLFIFRDRQGLIRFVQVRVDLENGDKRYVPHTFWSDGVWRRIEPETGLPLYNINEVEEGDVVFIHEGAKAACAAKAIAGDPNHPWHEDFAAAKHVGWIGGVHQLFKNMWHELVGLPSRVVIFPDNDYVGKSCVSKISKELGCRASWIDFTNEWPIGYDMADPFPANLTGEGGIYIGPPLSELMYPCTWATEDVSPPDANRPIYEVKDAFGMDWYRIQQVKGYASLQRPNTLLDKEQFNNAVRAYSDVPDTAALLSKVSGTVCHSPTFMPNKPTGPIKYNGEKMFNQYVDMRTRPADQDGDTSTFWRFFEYLLPKDEEREIVWKWICTLYARPHVRMHYGILFLSRTQGVGKSTILEMLARLIGPAHASFPSDATIQSDFNGWAVNKRLICVHEIYAGQSWKTYNRLKTMITDDSIDCNIKHMPTYTIPNYVHFAAASNSFEALRVEHDDRRWFVPSLPEFKFEDYTPFYEWMKLGGLRYLAREMLAQEDYVLPGEAAPSSESKDKLIDQSMPTEERFILIMLSKLDDQSTVSVQDIWEWLFSRYNGRFYITPQRISEMLREQNYPSVRDGKEVYACSSEAAWKTLTAISEEKGDPLIEVFKKRIVKPETVMNEQGAM